MEKVPNNGNTPLVEVFIVIVGLGLVLIIANVIKFGAQPVDKVGDNPVVNR